MAGGKFNIFDPFAHSRAVDDPIINEAREIGALIGMPSRTISGTLLTQHEYSLYQKVQGKILREALADLISFDAYKDMAIVDKEKAFKKVIRDIRQQINDLYFPALMMQRYDLPSDTNPKLLRILLAELNKNDKFKKFAVLKQERVIKKLLKIEK